jgi:recombinational DNA repair protein (RecF pathway)
MEEKISGLLLQSIPYLGQQKILKVLTAESGLLSFMSKSPKHPTTPFALAEWVYRRTQKEIHTLLDATLLDPLPELRRDYLTLTTAGTLVQDLLRTQFPHKKAPLDLAYAYLKKLPRAPTLLLASFRLRLLAFEGLLSPDPLFTPAEWAQIEHLATARHFSTLLQIEKAPLEKICHFFEMRITH